MELKIIAKIHNGYTDKFGIPRQSGLVEGVVSALVFEPEYRVKEAFRGLEDYSHLWLIWEFSKTVREGWSPTVRPPRLGGNKRMGVFATRSPYRPNELGLSSVKIEKIDLNTEDGPVIYVSGADLLDGTPVFDIKPYLPFTDSHPDAKAGFAQDHLRDQLEVLFDCDTKGIEETVLNNLKEILSQDPRPHYQEDGERVYKMDLLGYHLDFVVEDGALKVKEIH